MTSSPMLILGDAGKTGRRVPLQLGARGVAFRLAPRSSEPLSAGDGAEAWIDTDDVGGVATVALLDGAEALRDLFAVIRNRRSECVSDGVGQVLGRQPRDFTDWASATAAKGAWTVQPPMGQVSHDFSDDTVTLAAASLVQAES